MKRSVCEYDVGNTCKVCLYWSINTRVLIGIKRGREKSKFCVQDSFLLFCYRRGGKKPSICFKPLLELCEIIYRWGVLYTRAFYWLPCQWIRALFYKKKVSTFFAAILGFHSAAVKCKFLLNWALMEVVFKQPVRRREAIQPVGCCVLQSPPIITIILWKQTNKTSYWLALVCALSIYLQSTISRLKIN